jgi:hypothetical protein
VDAEAGADADADAELDDAVWALAHASARHERLAWPAHYDGVVYVMSNASFHGGFGLSDDFLAELTARTGVQPEHWVQRSSLSGAHVSTSILNVRTHPAAVNLLRERGSAASSGRHAHVVLSRISPASHLKYCRVYENEYDGSETLEYRGAVAIEEAARRWAAEHRGGTAIDEADRRLAAAIALADSVVATCVRVEGPSVRVVDDDGVWWVPLH